MTKQSATSENSKMPMSRHMIELFAEVFTDIGRWAGSCTRGSNLIWQNTLRPSCHTHRWTSHMRYSCCRRWPSSFSHRSCSHRTRCTGCWWWTSTRRAAWHHRNTGRAPCSTYLDRPRACQSLPSHSSSRSRRSREWASYRASHRGSCSWTGWVHCFLQQKNTRQKHNNGLNNQNSVHTGL